MTEGNPATAAAPRDRIMSADARNILDSAKPSILDAAPRRGGYVRKEDGPPKEKENKATSQTRFKDEEDTKKKGSCCCKPVAEQGSAFISSVEYGGDRPSCQGPPPVESLYKKSNFSAGGVDSFLDTSAAENASMLAIAISTVMLMASEFPRIPDEYLEYTKNYLECIKDINEQNPPNIQGILKHITYLRDNGLVRPMGEESRQEIPAVPAEGGAEAQPAPQEGAAAEGGAEGIAEGGENADAGAQRSPRVRGASRRHPERLRSHPTPLPRSGDRYTRNRK